MNFVERTTVARQAALGAILFVLVLVYATGQAAEPSQNVYAPSLAQNITFVTNAVAVVVIHPDGSIEWKGRKVATDAQMQAAMVDAMRGLVCRK